MKSSDTLKNENSEHNDYINYRMGELKNILRKLGESFIKFLFAAHSGGILAVAGILKIQTTGLNIYTNLALTCFVFGLLTTAFLLLKMLFRIHAIDKAWHKNTAHWYNDEISWGELNNRDKVLTQNDGFEFMLAVISLIFFLCGVLSGTAQIWCGN